MDFNHIFILVINYLGTLAFAMSGAMAGIKRDADIIGCVFLALMACSCGGLARDILIGDLPPELLRTVVPLIFAVLTAAFAMFFSEKLEKIKQPIDFFDALGLGLFVVVGANKAIAFGVNPVWCILMGLLTGVGGGVARDIILAQVPTIFRAEIYATPALLGAFVFVFGAIAFPMAAPVFMIIGAALCTGLRLVAMHYGWHIKK